MATYDKETIIRYAENELTEEERLLFETAMEGDAALAAEVALYGQLRTALEQRLPVDKGAEALQATLRELNAKYFAAKPIPVIRWLSGIAAAAAVILAIVWAWPSGTKAYLDKLGHTEMIGTAERGAHADTLLQQASDHFNKEEFDKALPLLDKVIDADSNSQLALFYRGVAEWHVGSIDAARKDLQIVYTKGSLLQSEAAFYMALSYAGQDNKTAAREWLNKIPQDAPAAEKAAALSKKLE